MPGGGDFIEQSIDDFERRRTRLAAWVTAPENLLTARVIANFLWAYPTSTSDLKNMVR